MHITGVSGHQDLVLSRNSVKSWFHGLPRLYRVHAPFHTSSTEHYPCRASQNKAESQGLRILMPTLPVSCCFNPPLPLQGQPWAPRGEAFWALAFTLSPLTHLLQYPPILHLHAHTAGLSAHPLCLRSPSLVQTVHGSQECLVNLGFCHIHLTFACPGGHQGYTPHRPPSFPGALWPGLPLLRRSSNWLDCRSGRKEKKGFICQFA